MREEEGAPSPQPHNLTCPYIIGPQNVYDPYGMPWHGTAHIWGDAPKRRPNEHLIVLARHFLVMLYLFLIIEQIRVHARARAHARIRGRQKYGPSFVQRYVQTIGALKPKAENKFSFN